MFYDDGADANGYWVLIAKEFFAIRKAINSTGTAHVYDGSSDH
jgi:hypothetical protein